MIFVMLAACAAVVAHCAKDCVVLECDLAFAQEQF